MSLQYRFIAQDDRHDATELAEKAFAVWIREQKGLSVDVSVTGRHEVATGIEVSVLKAASDDLVVHRYSLYEDNPSSGGRWATILTVITDALSSWLWVDLEWVSEDPWGRTPSIRPPRLVRYLLLDGSVHIGPVALGPNYFVTGSASQAKQLGALIKDDQRRSPLVAISHDRSITLEEANRRAGFITRELTGIAPVFLLSEEATRALNESLDPGLRVYGGAVRTYMPLDDVPMPMIRRHRVLSGQRLAENLTSAASIIGSTLRIRALSARPPTAYRQAGRQLLQDGLSGESVDLLLADAIAAEEASDAATIVANGLRDDLEWQTLELEESLSEVDKLQARNKFLENLLAESKINAAGMATPELLDPIVVDSFHNLLVECKSRLKWLEVGFASEPGEALDQYPQATTWARKAWRALQALNDYSAARSTGWSGDFKSWCVSPLPGKMQISADWVSLLESDSVDKNPKYHDSRVFSVPTSVDKTGAVYMCSHIKLVEGGRPAPRIHFYDDTAGASKRVYVGYVGAHLPNGQTN